MKQSKDNAVEQVPFVNPIDKDKISENPGLLEYASNVGSAIIKPLDKGRIKGQAMNAMYEQTTDQLTKIKKQVELLMAQAAEVHERLAISEMVYQADVSIKPIIGQVYHLYRRANGKYVLSMIAPSEWGAKMPFESIASVRLLSDHTWKVIDGNLENWVTEV